MAGSNPAKATEGSFDLRWSAGLHRREQSFDRGERLRLD
jgi:hypothetical protein